MKYDYLIVGAGLYGATFAHQMKLAGKSCLVIEKRNHIGGNTYCSNNKGIVVHEYGAHIFHTNDAAIWNFVNSFVEFTPFINSPKAMYYDEYFNLPFNMNTFKQLWGVSTEEEARAKLKEQTAKYQNISPTNLQEQALTLVGDEIFEKLIKHYTEKQWGRPCDKLPAFIIKRLPLRFTFDNNYFNDKYQGIPKGGYNKLTEKLLEGIEVRLGIDFLQNREQLEQLAKTIVFTGKIDAYFDYCLGELEYRSLHFNTLVMENTSNFQNNAVINHTSPDVPYTRVVEHKHFEWVDTPHTVVSYEYPQKYIRGGEAYYPINDEKNNSLYRAYRDKANALPNYIFGGRLAEYKYYDMHQVIAAALHKTKVVLQNE
ncbi:MAG: UDP-galactopyranose mutase [Bacteroidia bacterium]|nr:UDP-galactopyranose mutase [Bacteroidia bacterium]